MVWGVEGGEKHYLLVWILFYSHSGCVEIDWEGEGRELYKAFSGILDDFIILKNFSVKEGNQWTSFHFASFFFYLTFTQSFFLSLLILFSTQSNRSSYSSCSSPSLFFLFSVAFFHLLLRQVGSVLIIIVTIDRKVSNENNNNSLFNYFFFLNEKRNFYSFANSLRHFEIEDLVIFCPPSSLSFL